MTQREIVNIIANALADYENDTGDRITYAVGHSFESVWMKDSDNNFFRIGVDLAPPTSSLATIE